MRMSYGSRLLCKGLLQEFTWKAAVQLSWSRGDRVRSSAAQTGTFSILIWPDERVCRCLTSTQVAVVTCSEQTADRRTFASLP